MVRVGLVAFDGQVLIVALGADGRDFIAQAAAGIAHDRISPLHQLDPPRRAPQDGQLPVAPWVRAYGLDRDPGSRTGTVPLPGLGPAFDRGYALATDLAQPVLIATLPAASGPPCPLQIDGLCTTGHCPQRSRSDALAGPRTRWRGDSYGAVIPTGRAGSPLRAAEGRR